MRIKKAFLENEKLCNKELCVPHWTEPESDVFINAFIKTYLKFEA